MHGLAMSSDQWVVIERVCPDYDCNKQRCLAARDLLAPNFRQQMSYCLTCDYDNCPIYLAKALRSSRTQCLVRDSIVDSGK